MSWVGIACRNQHELPTFFDRRVRSPRKSLVFPCSQMYPFAVLNLHHASWDNVVLPSFKRLLFGGQLQQLPLVLDCTDVKVADRLPQGELIA